ncbi:MAG TPA: hypothetical protein VM938_06925, partial [Acidimicrobiales bacterium]|nr:hypothetical protein [Acidimicrobiales bacterium]
RPGRPTHVRLLSDLGDGDEYELPGGVVSRLTEDGISGPALQRHYYVKLPAEFWANGWMAIMTGPALAMFLTLLTEMGDKPHHTELWLSPGEADERVGLSEETRSKGLRELQRLDLVEMRRRPIGRDVFDFRRLRNVYVLQLERLNKRPDE